MTTWYVNLRIKECKGAHTAGYSPAYPAWETTALALAASIGSIAVLQVPKSSWRARHAPSVRNSADTKKHGGIKGGRQSGAAPADRGGDRTRTARTHIADHDSVRTSQERGQANPRGAHSRGRQAPHVCICMLKQKKDVQRVCQGTPRRHDTPHPAGRRPEGKTAVSPPTSGGGPTKTRACCRPHPMEMVGKKPSRRQGQKQRRVQSRHDAAAARGQAAAKTPVPVRLQRRERRREWRQRQGGVNPMHDRRQIRQQHYGQDFVDDHALG